MEVSLQKGPWTLLSLTTTSSYVGLSQQERQRNIESICLNYIFLKKESGIKGQ